MVKDPIIVSPAKMEIMIRLPNRANVLVLIIIRIMVVSLHVPRGNSSTPLLTIVY